MNTKQHMYILHVVVVGKLAKQAANFKEAAIAMLAVRRVSIGTDPVFAVSQASLQSHSPSSAT